MAGKEKEFNFKHKRNKTSVLVIDFSLEWKTKTGDCIKLCLLQCSHNMFLMYFGKLETTNINRK